ncbi:hypothetical protein BV898_17794 [Hypsibius exemplaris]|uniref:Uncharacterized protein n=1 Tax=Hypsibius exemplaris TaxID=2072580 RepID=A0A9X6RN60_HYPEX|nr:hypothetical protein BV898_17794 [Hypsibius exemplaris]
MPHRCDFHDGTWTTVWTSASGDGLKDYYIAKIEQLQLAVSDKTQNLRRLQAQRNELNAKVRLLREELQMLQEQGLIRGRSGEGHG